MNWKKNALIATTVMAVLLSAIAFRVGSTPMNELSHPAFIKANSPTEIPFTTPVSINGLSLTGNFKGTGFAQVWLVGEGRKYLAVDTEKLDDLHFENACEETCNLPPINPESIIILVHEGTLSIEEEHLTIPAGPAGLAICPNCNRVTQSETPDHSLFLIVVLLVAAILGAHVLSHSCSAFSSRRIAAAVFITAFATLTVLFGASLAAPTSAIATTAKHTASILSAIGVLSLFAIGGFELNKLQQQSQQPDVWKELEEAEDEWERK